MFAQEGRPQGGMVAPDEIGGVRPFVRHRLLDQEGGPARLQSQPLSSKNGVRTMRARNRTEILREVSSTTRHDQGTLQASP